MSIPVGYVAGRLIEGFGTDITAGTRDFTIETNPGMEMRHIILVSDTTAYGANLEWRLIHPGNDYDTDAIMAMGKVSDFYADRKEIFSSRTATIGYHRPLIFSVMDTELGPSLDVTASAKTISNLTVSIEYSPERENEIQGVSNDRS